MAADVFAYAIRFHYHGGWLLKWVLVDAKDFWVYLLYCFSSDEEAVWFFAFDFLEKLPPAWRQIAVTYLCEINWSNLWHLVEPAFVAWSRRRRHRTTSRRESCKVQWNVNCASRESKRKLSLKSGIGFVLEREYPSVDISKQHYLFFTVHNSVFTVNVWFALLIIKLLPFVDRVVCVLLLCLGFPLQLLISSYLNVIHNLQLPLPLSFPPITSQGIMYLENNTSFPDSAFFQISMNFFHRIKILVFFSFYDR